MGAELGQQQCYLSELRKLKVTEEMPTEKSLTVTKEVIKQSALEKWTIIAPMSIMSFLRMLLNGTQPRASLTDTEKQTSVLWLPCVNTIDLRYEETPNTKLRGVTVHCGLSLYTHSDALLSAGEVSVTLWDRCCY